MINTLLKRNGLDALNTSLHRASVWCLCFLFSFVFCLTGGKADAAAAHKSCSNHLRHTHKCATVKQAKHRGRHATFTRPQPASFVMDADSGKVLESENADSPRYPASLTKMMTLYLTFDALKKGTLKFDSMLSVSQHGSMQPQTNIALQPGDRLAVKDAILSIVVRSANDAAVTLAENIAGSEEGFARKMTEKARSLGMKNTVFYNASGLPEPRQHTTARDMAVLGLALRKNFPQYFPFFKTESFSYNGVTYPTHNHVMTRYEGVDGIKTGYIRASGFNLVTSVKRDGHTLIGVVLGGPSFRSRDDKMIAMLDRQYTRIAANGKSNYSVARAAPAIPAIAEEEAAEGQGDVNNEAMAEDDSKVLTAGNRQVAVEAVIQPVPAQVAERKPAAATAKGEKKADWGIQIGLYPRKTDAVQAASSAMKQAPRVLGSSQILVSDVKVKSQYRSRLVNLTAAEAKDACNQLENNNIACFTFQQ